MEGILNECLKSGRSIGQAKRHDSVFVETKMCVKGSLPFIAFFDTD